jgi:hypothetical protein
LRRVIDFLNERGAGGIAGAEIKQWAGQGKLSTLVPQVDGLAAHAWLQKIGDSRFRSMADWAEGDTDMIASGASRGLLDIMGELSPQALREDIDYFAVDPAMPSSESVLLYFRTGSAALLPVVFGSCGGAGPRRTTGQAAGNSSPS